MEVILINSVPLSRSTLISVLMAQGRNSDDAVRIANFVYKIAKSAILDQSEIAEFITTLIRTDVEIFSHSVDEITHSVRHLKLSSTAKRNVLPTKQKKVRVEHE